jgi:putative ABC transport system substrate-binding protein
MKRRELILGLGGAAVAWPMGLRAQQRRVPLVGVLRTSTAATDTGINGFRRSLQRLGYVEGQNIRVEVRWSDGDNERLPALAAELAALNPDVIVSNGEPAIRAVKDAAGATPIVMSVVGDPVAAGLAQSLAHPGGNLTGLTNLAGGLVAKRLQLLLEIVPDPGCVAVMRDPSERALDPLYWQEATTAAQTLGVVLKPVAVGSAGELEAGFAEIAREHCLALLVMSSAVYFGARLRFAELAAQHRIAASYDNRVIAAAGGLMSYGPDTADMLRRAALYVDKILKGANPADLPIEQPTKFELVINLKTAKVLGLTVPQALLARADEVIE